MSSTFGRLFRVTTFGESHGAGIGAVIDGCPPGLAIAAEEIQADLDKRRPGDNLINSARKEKDQVEILSGIYGGITLGSPIALLVRNIDARPEDYTDHRLSYRPAHADYTTEAKYGIRDPRGGGRASARETVGRVAAGAIARKLLRRDFGIEVLAWVDSIGQISSISIDPETVSHEEIDSSIVRCPDTQSSIEMAKSLTKIRKEGDSIGGSIRCVARSVPPGWGEPVFDKLSCDLAKGLMSIPSACGFEFGEGFSSISLKGSDLNESLSVNKRKDLPPSLPGGIQGGISNGQSIRMRVAFKPPSTVLGKEESLQDLNMDSIGMRHDSCVVIRAVPVVESMVLLVLADHHLRQRALTGK